MRLTVLCLVVLAAGCVRIEHPDEAVAAIAPSPIQQDTAPWHENLRHAAHLAAMAYGASTEHERIERGPGDELRAQMPGLSVGIRLRLFARRGLHAAYVAPRLWIMPWVHHPELYVLGDTVGQTMTVVFVGSNGPDDWYQNLKASVYEDDGDAGDPYIPSGHAGFRRGVRNLAACGFFDRIMPTLADGWGIRPGSDGRIPVFVAGHSLGAAIALLSLPAIDGWSHRGTRAPDGGFELERRTGAFAVRGAFLIAPPYAIASDTFIDPDLPMARVLRNHHAYAWMRRAYGAIIWNVMHEADTVCALYDVRQAHEVSLKHLGHLVRIDGSGQARLVETD
ncbi:MAG TPA: hypothetical protein DCS97_03650 [Planctomycetes bacterium]|nr:hypothetical protein [Planctomycetota bacterium]